MAIHGTNSVGASKVHTANRAPKKPAAASASKPQAQQTQADRNDVNFKKEAPSKQSLQGFLGNLGNTLGTGFQNAADKVADGCAGVAKGFSGKGEDATTIESVQLARQVEKFAGPGVAREVAKAPGTLRDAVCSVPKGVAENAQGVAGLLGHPLRSADIMGSKLEQFGCQLKHPNDFLHRQVDGFVDNVKQKGAGKTLMDGLNTVTHPFKAVLGKVEGEALDSGRRAERHH